MFSQKNHQATVDTIRKREKKPAMGIRDLLTFVRENAPGAIEFIHDQDLIRFAGQTVMIDVSNYMYIFLYRRKPGLTDEQFLSTSFLPQWELLTHQYGWKVIYVFDGDHPAEKTEENQKRSKIRLDAHEEKQRQIEWLEQRRKMVQAGLPDPQDRCSIRSTMTPFSSPDDDPLDRNTLCSLPDAGGKGAKKRSIADQLQLLHEINREHQKNKTVMIWFMGYEFTQHKNLSSPQKLILFLLFLFVFFFWHIKYRFWIEKMESKEPKKVNESTV